MSVNGAYQLIVIHTVVSYTFDILSYNLGGHC